MNKYDQGNPWSTSIPVVGEQPGLRVSILGIVLAVVMSFTIQGYFSQNRIETVFRPLLRQIHPQLTFDFQSVQLSLRDGFIPRVAMVMDQVKIEINNNCFQGTTVDIDQVTLPFSIFSYFVGKNPIDEIRLGHVKTILASSPLHCQELNKDLSNVPLMIQSADSASPQPSTANQGPIVAKPKVSLAPATAESNTSSQIQKVSIRSLEIYRSNDIEPILNIGDLVFDLLSDQPKHIVLSSKLNLFQENRGIDYFSQGELEAQYREYPEKKVDLSLVGHIREGSYRFEASFLFNSMDFQVNADVQHVPVYPFIHLMRKLEVVDIQIPAGKMWTSFQAQAKGSASDWQSSQMVVKPIAVEGEFGAIRSDVIQLQNIPKPQFGPFKVTTQNLKLDYLFDPVFLTKNLPFIQSLGAFQGYLQYQANREIQISGIHNGLEFIFSNLGQRKIQKIDNLILEMVGKNDQWKAEIPRMDLDDGIFDGDIKMSYAVADRILELTCDVDEIVFSNEVQKMMTSGGHVGGASLFYHGLWKGFKLVSQNGTVKLSSSDIYGIEVSKAAVKIASKETTETKTSLLNFQFANVKVAADSPWLQKVPILINEMTPKENYYWFKEASSQFEIENLQNVAWKDFLIVHPKGRVQSQGGWKETGELYGTVQSYDYSAQSPKQKKWAIKGLRDAPQFEE